MQHNSGDRPAPLLFSAAQASRRRYVAASPRTSSTTRWARARTRGSCRCVYKLGRTNDFMRAPVSRFCSVACTHSVAPVLIHVSTVTLLVIPPDHVVRDQDRGRHGRGDDVARRLPDDRGVRLPPRAVVVVHVCACGRPLHCRQPFGRLAGRSARAHRI
jgi:hypothetical protein